MTASVSKLEPAAEFARVDTETASARRKFDAAVELLMAFDPSASTLEEAARAIAKVANKAMKGNGE